MSSYKTGGDVWLQQIFGISASSLIHWSLWRYRMLSSFRNFQRLFLRKGTCVGDGQGEEIPHAPISVASDGVKFQNIPAPFRQITEIPEYWFDDLLPEDTVIDIGANIGAFCIRAARRSRRVVAVEPVTTDLLRQNIRLNGVNVQVIGAALGDGRPAVIDWDGCRVFVQTYPLRDIIHAAGGCDFLKCDCEGAEWQIDPCDLSGIRRIEMELHQPPISGPPEPALLEYICREYEFTIDRTPCHGPLGHMGVLHANRRSRAR